MSVEPRRPLITNHNGVLHRVQVGSGTGGRAGMFPGLPRRVTAGQARVVMAVCMALPAVAFGVRVMDENAPHRLPDPRRTMDTPHVEPPTK